MAREYADWDSLNARVEVIHDPFPDTETLVARLAEFDVLVAMRERTHFPADMLRRLRVLVVFRTAVPFLVVFLADHPSTYRTR